MTSISSGGDEITVWIFTLTLHLPLAVLTGIDAERAHVGMLELGALPDFSFYKCVCDRGSSWMFAYHPWYNNRLYGVHAHVY
jgi:hypothetical protein